jgi:hypothetical protein
MSELKAMVLVAVAVVFVSTVLNAVLMVLHASSEALALSLLLTGILASIGLTRVIKHYAELDERRKRERILSAR